MSTVVHLRDLRLERGSETILQIPELSIESGSQTLLMGGSGSGKSSLIHLLAGFLAPTAGRYLFEGQDVTGLKETDWDLLRATRIGVVFQHYPLLRGFSVLENLLIPMGLAGKPDRGRAVSMLERVGLGHRLQHRPSQLSAGQRQRVALIRALVNRPPLVLADEPTAHLDPESGKAALSLLKELVAESGSTLILVSHDHSLKADFSQHLLLEQLNQAHSGPSEVPA